MMVIRRVCAVGLLADLVNGTALLFPHYNAFALAAIPSAVLLVLALWLTRSLALPARIGSAVTTALGIMLAAAGCLAWIPFVR